MPRKLLGHIARRGLAQFGYVLWRKDFLRYGVCPLLDVSRLNRAWGRSVHTFFDVGAHTGQTCREAMRVFPDARVYAFEPHPMIFSTLQTAISDERVSLHQLALGDHAGE